jgi:hypothetical protein
MKKGYVTYKDKYNTKYGYKKNESHTLEEISKDTGVSMKGLQQIYNKGIGAYKTNPTSVRPNVKSKEQWAMARVYSAVMGGKTAKIDAKELKMEKGGMTRIYSEGGKVISDRINSKLESMGFVRNPSNYLMGKKINENLYIQPFYDKNKDIYKIRGVKKFKTTLGGNSIGLQFDFDNEKDFFDKINELSSESNEMFAEGGKITQFEIESMRNYINSPNPNPKLKDSFEKVLRKFGVDLERSDLSDFTKGRYVNPYNFSGYEYMRKINEEAGVSFLLTGEYELVSKAIYEKDYAMWLFYSYLGRINISFKACENWLQQAQDYFEQTMPIPIWLVHTPKAKDGRSYAMWVAVSSENKAEAESRLGRPLVFEYEGRYYYQEIGMVGNFDANNSDGWGSLYKEKKTGLLIPEYTETSFHFNTLIHEFSHCLDFQSQLLKNIDKYDNNKAKKLSGDIEINTETMSDAELALYANQLRREGQKDNVVSLPITNHFDEFVNSLIRVLRACAGGHISLTQLYEQQALDVQTALEGVYGDLLLEQRARREQERREVEKADQMRENTRFSWQTSWINDIKKYALQNALQADLKDKLQSTGKNNFTLSEIIELDNLITQYFNMEFKKYMIQNPTKGSERLEDIKRLKKETNRIINNHYDNIKSNFQYGFQPQNELEYYIFENCKLSDFRDYKSWKDCVKEKLEKFG